MSVSLPSINPNKFLDPLKSNNPSILTSKKKGSVKTYSISQAESVIFTDKPPPFILGYTGRRFKTDPFEKDAINDRFLEKRPISGYTGCYRGKVSGKLGRIDVHEEHLAAWDKKTVCDILGSLRPDFNDWDFVHKSSLTCNNFIDPAVNPSTYADDFGTAHNVIGNGHAPTVTGREGAELMNLLRYVRYCLEVRFNTSLLARSTLKAAFFNSDKDTVGTVNDEQFFEILRKTANIELQLSEQYMICNALSDSETMMTDGLLQYNMKYGRFLNIVVPKTK